ncbi:MAG: hypothetical protein A2X25_11745 [Chloroflexi bacterium GWB2_49_20]|nr:MAG: hypothetical protein A2X25_11745 [Chloroflexi bacterium GWB2_49_20]OGN77678.1 MAG: hypothetical protein A2X26_10015 [Chloroflexi bacterium GWC2_49_37]OGN86453.1 MAG: hypothetical protein A2X27_06170 [Chloroflexi bacterium GWD2_49_16]HBG74698.1 hypothetical protein [Anaerolineae bacterium]
MDDLCLSKSIRSFSGFVAEGCGVDLYDYQLLPAQAVLESVRLGQGLTFVLNFPRQSGKDELLAHLQAYLMRMSNDKDRTILEVNSNLENHRIALWRLEERLSSNVFTRSRWARLGDTVAIDKCRTTFLPADGVPDGKVAPASLLFIVNDAQDIWPAWFDMEFSHLAARPKLTRLVCGSSWDEQSLLSREIRHARRDEDKDGIQRLFRITALDVGKENQNYANFIDDVVQRYGRENPLVKTQYFSEEVDAEILKNA